MTIRILVADDHPIFRDGVVQSLEETDDLRVVAIASSAAEAIELCKKEQPDVALLDLSMPGGGLTAVRKIASEQSETRIAMLTVSEDDEHVAKALNLGAIGYILKGVSAAELRRIVKGVAAGEAHVSPSLATKVLTYMSQKSNTKEASVFDDLTSREEDILRLVAKGLSNKEVAIDLGLQEKTVKHYMTTIMSKLHARNRVEAALMAHEEWKST